jgi:hypothetical protein
MKQVTGEVTGREYLEDLDVNGRIIVEWIVIGWESVDWIQLAQNRDQWWAFVNTVVNLRVT